MVPGGGQQHPCVPEPYAARAPSISRYVQCSSATCHPAPCSVLAWAVGPLPGAGQYNCKPRVPFGHPGLLTFAPCRGLRPQRPSLVRAGFALKRPNSSWGFAPGWYGTRRWRFNQARHSPFGVRRRVAALDCRSGSVALQSGDTSPHSKRPNSRAPTARHPPIE